MLCFEFFVLSYCLNKEWDEGMGEDATFSILGPSYLSKLVVGDGIGMLGFQFFVLLNCANKEGDDWMAVSSNIRL